MICMWNHYKLAIRNSTECTECAYKSSRVIGLTERNRPGVQTVNIPFRNYYYINTSSNLCEQAKRRLYSLKRKLARQAVKI